MIDVSTIMMSVKWPCRQAGMLKVCSESLYFVPRDNQEPICRYPLSAISVLERCMHGSSTLMCS